MGPQIPERHTRLHLQLPGIYGILCFPFPTILLLFPLQSAVMSVAFSKFHPSYIIGGTYSGQLVLWDIRSGKRTPVQRSPLSSSAHTHPVYCLDVVGTENAHNLISASNDGRLCSWNLDNLSQPQVLLVVSGTERYFICCCRRVWS